VVDQAFVQFQIGSGRAPGLRAGTGDALQFGERLHRRHEQVGTPFELHKRLRPWRSGVVEVDPHHLALVFETIGARVAHLGHAQERITRRGIGAAAVGAADPALNRFELLGDAGVVGHEDQAALGVGWRCRVIEHRPIRHAASHDTRHACVARVGAPHMGMERATAALRVGAVVERVACTWAGQRVTAERAAHHLRLQHIDTQARGLGDARQARVQRSNVLPQSAQHQKAAVVKQRVRCGRVAVAVRIAQQQLAGGDAVVPGRHAARVTQFRLADAVDEAETVACFTARPLRMAAHGLHTQHLHARMRGHQLRHGLAPGFEGARPFARGRALPNQGRARKQLQHDVHHRHLHPLHRRARTRRRGPVALGQGPLARMIALRVAQLPGARLHALEEFGRELVQLCL
jgi:hypothetical protein